MPKKRVFFGNPRKVLGMKGHNRGYHGGLLSKAATKIAGHTGAPKARRGSRSRRKYY